MHLTLHMTTACNMRCSYCYAPPHAGNIMTRETAFKALEMGREKSEKSCGVIFFGGEPLLCKELIAETVVKARQLEESWSGQYHFKVTTNGLLLDDEFLAFAEAANVMVGLSLDGCEAAHDAHRRTTNGGPTFQTIHRRAAALVKSQPYSSVLMVINPDTAKRLCESVRYLIEGLGFRYVICSPNYAADWDEKTFRILHKQFEEMGDIYIEWTQRERKFYFSPFEVKISSHVNQHCFQKDRCELGQKQISVAPDGHLYPCVQFPAEGPDSRWCIGHIDTGIDERKRLLLYHESEAEKVVCKKCAVKTRCNNTCGCLNLQTTGSVNEISPFLCRYEQMLLPIADRIGRTLYKKRDPLFIQKHYNDAYPVLSLIEDTAES